MNKEEAIKLLICEKVCVEDVDDNIGGERVRQAYDMAIEALKSERPKGEWIKATGVAPPEYVGRYVCSNCGHYALMNMPYGSRQELSHFCPHCGVRLVSENEYVEPKPYKENEDI